MTDLVTGEASESDEETAGDNQKVRIIASEVSGEATESDEDIYEKCSQETINRSNADIYKNNLLQRKLTENNRLIWKHLNAFTKKLVTTASNQLLNTDHILIKSQVSTQSVVSSLKVAQDNIKYLHRKSNYVFTTFIPNVKKIKI